MAFADAFVYINSVIEVAAAFTGITNLGIIIFPKIRKIITGVKSERILKITKNLKRIKADPVIMSFYENDYKRLAFLETNKLDLSSKNQKALFRFYKKQNDNFTWEQVKAASKYFDYSGKKIKIKIKKMDWFVFAYFIVSSISMFFFSLTAIVKCLLSNLWQQGVTYGLTGLLAFFFTFYLISQFVAPINLAAKLKNNLNNKNKALQ